VAGKALLPGTSALFVGFPIIITQPELRRGKVMAHFTISLVSITLPVVQQVKQRATMKSFQHSNNPIRINNLAVKELRFGNTKEAMSLFAKALRECRSLVAQCPPSMAPSVSGRRFQVDDYIQEQSIPMVNSSSWYNGSYFYSEPISPTPVEREVEYGRLSMEVSEICSIITFNLGICFYKASHGKESTTKTKDLRKSLAFFEKSQQLCQGQGGLYASPVPLFSMALLNNMGVILRLIGQDEISQVLFDEIMVFGFYRCASHPSQLVHHHQSRSSTCLGLFLDGCLVNALHGQANTAAAA
jgi:hypothetical protein